MGLFGKAEETKADAPLDPAAWFAAQKSREAELNARAQAVEPEALDKRPALRVEFAEEYAADRKAYRFACRRWGDFLTVEMERRGREGWGGNVTFPVAKFAGSLNLGGVKSIELREGHAPDEAGEVRYYKTAYGSAAGTVEEIRANTPLLQRRRLLEFEVDSSSVSHVAYGDRITYTTKDYPRPAGDDVITFSGIGAALYAPAGMGADVLAAILREIERGYEPKPLPGSA